MTKDQKPHFVDEIIKGIIFSVAVLLAIIKLDFSKKVDMDGRLNKYFKPYILKLDIMAVL